MKLNKTTKQKTILLGDKLPLVNASISAGFAFGLTCKNLGIRLGIVNLLKSTQKFLKFLK